MARQEGRYRVSALGSWLLRPNNVQSNFLRIEEERSGMITILKITARSGRYATFITRPSLSDDLAPVDSLSHSPGSGERTKRT
jgi:hypothetical protein